MTVTRTVSVVQLPADDAIEQVKKAVSVATQAATAKILAPEEEGFVYYQHGGVPSKRKIRFPGDEGYVESFDSIPVISFANVAHPELAVRQALAKELAQAASKVGFFYAKDTPLSGDLKRRVFEAAAEFFALPEEDKLKCDWCNTRAARGYESFAFSAAETGHDKSYKTRESFYMGEDATEPEQHAGPVPEGAIRLNVWPESLPSFRETIHEYYAACMAFSRALTRIFALALGLDEFALDEHHRFPITALRANHYPSQDLRKFSPPGFLPHADYSSFTFVLQEDDGAEALEVLNFNGQWIKASPVPGCDWTCNIGDYLMQLSDGKFVSTVHRVINNSGKERTSVPFFYSPDSKCVIEPVKALGVERKSDAQAYVRQTVGQHYAQRIFYARPHHSTTLALKAAGVSPESVQYESYHGKTLA